MTIEQHDIHSTIPEPANINPQIGNKREDKIENTENTPPQDDDFIPKSLKRAYTNLSGKISTA